MKMNVRAGGTEGIGRGREMERRGRSCAPALPPPPGLLLEMELLFVAQEDSTSTQDGHLSKILSGQGQELRTSLGNF